jgi:hypothetical protein
MCRDARRTFAQFFTCLRRGFVQVRGVFVQSAKAFKAFDQMKKIREIFERPCKTR